jgi:hypothetical protein
LCQRKTKKPLRPSHGIEIRVTALQTGLAHQPSIPADDVVALVFQAALHIVPEGAAGHFVKGTCHGSNGAANDDSCGTILDGTVGTPV